MCLSNNRHRCVDRGDILCRQTDFARGQQGWAPPAHRHWQTSHKPRPFCKECFLAPPRNWPKMAASHHKRQSVQRSAQRSPSPHPGPSGWSSSSVIVQSLCGWAQGHKTDPRHWLDAKGPRAFLPEWGHRSRWCWGYSHYPTQPRKQTV